LGRAMATMTSVPWLACVLLLGLAHFTYPQERRRKMADEEEQEGGEAEVEAEAAAAAAATTKAEEEGAAAAAAEDILETGTRSRGAVGMEAVATAARNRHKHNSNAPSSYSPVVTHDDDGHGATNSPTNRSRSSSAAGDVWSSQPPRDLELVELASTRNPLVVDVDSDTTRGGLGWGE
jgi:hypothetical protein